MSAEARLEELGIVLPEPPVPVAAYVPVVISGTFAYVSGQVPIRDGSLPRTGLVGRDLTAEEAAEEARYCGLNVLAQLRAALGNLGRVQRMLKLTVFVASAPDFYGQPQVGNGVSDLMVQVFGDAGRHARSAVGVPALPLNAPVEVEAVVEVRAR